MGGVSVLTAILVGLLASFVQSLGLTIQRKSHVQDEARPLHQRKQPHRRPLWLLGFIVFISSNIFGTVFQIGALPIVILAPLGAVSLLWNALLAKILLGDVFTKTTFGGTVLVAGGAVLIAVFGVVNEPNHSLDDLLTLFARPAFVAFFSIVCIAVAVVIVSAHITSWTICRQLRCPHLDETPPTSPFQSNYASPRSPVPIPFRPTIQSRRHSTPTHPKSVHFKASPPPSLIIDIPPTIAQPTPSQQRSLTLAGLAFAAASGVLSGMSLVLAKAAIELLLITIEHYRTGNGENQFNRFQSWVLLVGMGIGGVLQLVYLNYSLTFASPALICPLAFCFFNLSSIFDGLVFYDQFGRLQPYQIALVSLGVVVLLLGVWVVSAIQPTGQGGVEVGTWVEEEDELEAAEGATLLGGDLTSEPYERPPETPVLGFILSETSSPHSPMSPRTRQRHRGPRYGTLMPDLNTSGPTGFSIGLGASSPGFILRGGSISLPPGQGVGARVRSRSEGNVGELMGVEDARVERDLEAWERERHERGRRRSGWWSKWLSADEGAIKLPETEETAV
ncbi:magnesium transporter, partial [Tremellales sp. Uapishka_1]